MNRYKTLKEFINEREFRVGDVVSMKNSGAIGKIVNINDVTNMIQLISDEGDTIETQLSDIEAIDNKIQKNLDDMLGKAKDAEKSQIVGQED